MTLKRFGMGYTWPMSLPMTSIDVVASKLYRACHVTTTVLLFLGKCAWTIYDISSQAASCLSWTSRFAPLSLLRSLVMSVEV